VETAIAEAEEQYVRLENCGLGGLTPADAAETLRNRQLCFAHICYLKCIREQIRVIGSRGGSIVLFPDGASILPCLGEKWKMMPEDKSFRSRIMTFETHGLEAKIGWEDCRPVPVPDGWFETVWKEYRELRER